MQIFELLLRNTINKHLSKAFGADWLIDQPPWLNDLPGRTNRQRTKIDDVRNKILFGRKHNVASHGKIVAALPFGFWSCLLGKSYTETLWVPVLRHCFPHHHNRDRSLIHARVESILDLRNRIAHHEPIIFDPRGTILDAGNRLACTHSEIIEAIGWICADTKYYAMSRCRFKDVLVEFGEFLDTKIVPCIGKGMPIHTRWIHGARNGLRVAVGRVKFFKSSEGYGYAEVHTMRDIRIESTVLERCNISALRKDCKILLVMMLRDGKPEVRNMYIIERASTIAEAQP